MAEFELRREATLKEWGLIRKKHPKLPSIEEMEATFRCTASEPYHMLSITAVDVMRFLSNVNYTIECILQPNRLVNMSEAKFISKEDKKNYFDMMKKLSYYYRKLQRADFVSENETVEAIIECYNFTKKEVFDFIIKFDETMMAGWKKEESVSNNDRNGYLG